VNVGVTVAVAVGVAVAVALGIGVNVGDAQGVPCPWQKLIFTASTRQPSLEPLVSLAIRQRSLPPGL
jgi:Na+-transporting NADH:ubiquinone oxidoreductase subunit NqrE